MEEALRVRGPSEVLPPDLIAGWAAHADQDLERAITLLRRAEVPDYLEAVRKIFLASTLAWTGDHGAAIELLQTVPAQTLPDP